MCGHELPPPTATDVDPRGSIAAAQVGAGSRARDPAALSHAHSRDQGRVTEQSNAYTVRPIDPPGDSFAP